MRCPNCGHELPQGKHKCLRCGYECKDLVMRSADDSEEEAQREDGEEKEETIEIDPSRVYMSGNERSSGGGIFGDIFGGGLFGGLFGDLFGGFFDEDDYYEDEESTAYDDFGNPIPIDVFDRDFVEVKEVEIIDPHGNAHKSKNGKINDSNVHAQPPQKKGPMEKLRNLRKKKDGDDSEKK